MTTFAEIEAACKTNPGTDWNPIAIALTESRYNEWVGGVICFARLNVEDGDVAYGTAAFFARDDDIGFRWGHYDMSYEKALDDFNARIGKGY